jgi:hypothetical protein
VRGDVRSQFPHPPQQRGGGIHGDRKRQQVIDRRVGLVFGQAPVAGVTPQHRRNLDPEQVGSGHRLIPEPLTEPLAVAAPVGHDRREDRGVNDEHVPR